MNNEEYLSEAEQKSRYRDVRARLWSGRPITAGKQSISKPMKKVVIFSDIPLWRRKQTNFNDHVVRWDSHRGTKWYLKYARVRAVDLGYPSFEILVKYGRKRHPVLARQIIMYEIYRDERKVSFPEIGRVFGFDHTTVLHAVNKIEERGLQASIDKLSRLKQDKKSGSYI